MESFSPSEQTPLERRKLFEQRALSWFRIGCSTVYQHAKRRSDDSVAKLLDEYREGGEVMDSTTGILCAECGGDKRTCELIRAMSRLYRKEDRYTIDLH